MKTNKKVLSGVLRLSVLAMWLWGCAEETEPLKESPLKPQTSSVTTKPTDTDKKYQLEVKLKTLKSQDEIEFQIINKTKDLVSITTPTTQLFDYTLKDNKGKVVYKYSDLKNFSQTLTTTEVKPEGLLAIDLELSKNLPNLPKGEYTLEVWVASKEHPNLKATIKLTLDQGVTSTAPKNEKPQTSTPSEGQSSGVTKSETDKNKNPETSKPSINTNIKEEPTQQKPSQNNAKPNQEKPSTAPVEVKTSKVEFTGLADSHTIEVKDSKGVYLAYQITPEVYKSIENMEENKIITIHYTVNKEGQELVTAIK